MNKDTQSWSNSNLTEMEELLQKMQQLETENADISHAYGVTRDVVKGLCEELANLKAENAALREDKERLNWLDESGAEVQKYGNSQDGSVLFFVDIDWSTVFAADTLRAALDAARAKEGQS